MLPTSAGVEPATSWSPVGRRIQLSHRDRTSREVQNKKDVEYQNKKDVVYLISGSDKQYVQTHMMIMTCINAYHMYRQKYQQDKTGLSKFKDLKPKQVRRISETNKNSYLCQV